MNVWCAGAGVRRWFERPHETIVARDARDVPEALARANDAIARGRYVAGFLSYDAGAGIVPRQAPGTRESLPLVVLGTFDRPLDAADARRMRDAARGNFNAGPLVPRVSSARYRAGIHEILRRIREGDVYQVNAACAFAFSFHGDPLALYAALASDFPHAAYVEFDDHAIVSCSPELFLRFEPARVTTKPMKGTAADAAHLWSEKNRAEHVMIVDLLRNDLHRVSDDVNVERLMEAERYPGYVTATSTIVARARGGVAFDRAFGAAFPCGSITGAPKMTAMQTIAEIEGPRGIFCGSIGYSAPDGTGEWNVAIRTASIERASGCGTLRVGGGIVADSQADSEWAEILVKRSFFARVAPGYSLVETLYRDATGTYPHRDAHLARLVRSADELHFVLDRTRVERTLDDEPQRDVLVRLECGADGAVARSVRPRAGDAEPVALIWATAVRDCADPLARYKTTWRPAYDAAAAEARDAGAFDALLCNERGDVCDGARTNVFVALPGEATLLTPPLASGALPGLLRARLIASGRVREARLRRDDVAHATALYAGNSARGLLRARLLTGLPVRR